MPRPTPNTILRTLLLLAVLTTSRFASAQAISSAPDEPIYWRQNLLTVPYQWTSDDGPQSTAKVSLFVSKDRGETWQAVGEAQPQLLAFNYRAEADGEYWFSIRTSAAGGALRLPPTDAASSAMRPELRVIVDTTLPRIESVTAQMRTDGILEARWRVADPHLSAHSCNVELQADGGNWQPIPLTGATEVTPGVWEGTATYVVTTSAAPTTVRATAIDLAGNRSVFQSSVSTTTSVGLTVNDDTLTRARSLASEPGWTSTSTPTLDAASQAALPQTWAADRVASATLDFTGEEQSQVLYGMPVAAGASADSSAGSPGNQLEIPQPTTEDRPLGNVPLHTARDTGPTSPFRHASLSHAKVVTEMSPRATNDGVPPLPANPLARLVNTPSFAVEYELAAIRDGGVSKVEVWGTRDGGQTWNLAAVDDDNRSPVDVTVDDDGEYGYSIVVTPADGTFASPPRAGDTPSLWVNVDREPPLAQIVSVDTRRGDIAGELDVRWEAGDENLEPRPISLYYSSRPAGPWTLIASELENSGEFRWPLARHVPRKIFLKLEARDTAGNRAEFQTSEAVVVELEPAATNWLRLPPVK